MYMKYTEICNCYFLNAQAIEEVRSLGVPENSAPEHFMEKSIGNLKENVDPIIYYGIMKGLIKPPTNPTIGK